MNPKEDLQALLKRGIDLNVNPQGFEGDASPRRSAVLILFGRLDSVMASPMGADALLSEYAHPGASYLKENSSKFHPATVPADLDVLLQRRSSGMRYHAGQIAFPGGGIDPGETPEEAAVREAHEETGIDPDAVEVLGTLPEVPLPVSNNIVTPVIGWWSRPSEIAAVDHTEAVEVFRVPVAEMLNPNARYTGVYKHSEGSFFSDAFKLSSRFGNRIVWGFTGGVLATLYEQLAWEETWDKKRQIPIV